MVEVWDPPSPAVAELIRAAVTRVLEQVDALFEAVDAVVLETTDPAVNADPALVARSDGVDEVPQ